MWRSEALNLKDVSWRLAEGALESIGVLCMLGESFQCSSVVRQPHSTCSRSLGSETGKNSSLHKCFRAILV